MRIISITGLQAIRRHYAWILTVLLCISINKNSQAQLLCPDLPGGHFSFGFSGAGQMFLYPGIVPNTPISPSSQGSFTAGRFGISDGVNRTFSEVNPAIYTFVPTLDGIMDGTDRVVVFQFITLDIPAGGELRIYEGQSTSGILRATINPTTQTDFVDEELVINGMATLVYTGPTGPDFYVNHIRFLTGDISFQSCRNRTTAVWRDFISANSYTPVDDTQENPSGNYLPSCVAFFDENKNFLRTEAAFCLDFPKDSPSPAYGYYPGQISYSLSGSNEYDIDRNSVYDEEDELKAARILWLINRAKTVTDLEELSSIQQAIWATQQYDTEVVVSNSWYIDAQDNVPFVPSPPEPDPFELALDTDETGQAIQNTPISLVIDFAIPGPAEQRLTLSYPNDVTVTVTSGGSFNQVSRILTITDPTVSLQVSSPTIGKATIQAIYAEPGYYNIKNLQVYEPCEDDYEKGYQSFLHVGEENHPQPFRAIEVEWTTSLPVTLVSFKASQEAGNVNLSWKTALEENFSHFEVERSENGRDSWREIGKVVSNTTASYGFVDSRPLLNRAYYRLKMIDLDDTFSYSPIESLSSNIGHDQLALYPNPAVNRIFVNSNDVKNVKLFNMAGVKMIESSNGAHIDVANFSEGIYVAVLDLRNGSQKTQRIIVKK